MNNVQHNIQGSILVILTWMLFSCGNTQADLARIEYSETFPDEVTKDVTFYVSDSAKLKVILTAPLMHSFHDEKDERVEFPDGFYVRFYDKFGKEESYIKADQGIYYQTEEWMEAKKNVEVLNNKGEKLLTNYLVWDQKKERIHTNELVTIIQGNQRIRGTGLDANQEFTKYKIRDLTGVFYNDDLDEEEYDEEEEE